MTGIAMTGDNNETTEIVIEKEVAEKEIRRWFRPMRWKTSEKVIFASILIFGLANLILNLLSFVKIV
jgi:hypothetical protein